MSVSKKTATDPKLKWFRDARLGMFVHFGLYSIPAQGEWLLNSTGDARAEYEALMHRFNPRRFDADAWVDVAEEMGAHYMTVTAKHHDGFCLYDSALTDYKVTNTPFKRDLIGELIETCHRRGMRICMYYSLLDWHHRNYDHAHYGTHGTELPGQHPDWPKYLDYYVGQVRELCTKYGRIDGLWFDGGAGTDEKGWRRDEVYRMIKRFQPHAAVNDRGGRGDYFSPERSLPDDLWGYHFEACQALGMEWGYHADCTLYSAPFLIRSLAHCVGHGGNFLLNFGPKADGTIPDDRLDLARRVGRWAKDNAEAVYGTDPVQMRATHSARNFTRVQCARRGRKLYLLVPEWPMFNRLLVPGLSVLPQSARLAGHKAPLSVRKDTEGIVICDLPPDPPQQGVNIVKLVFRSAPKPPRIPPPHVPVTRIADRAPTMLLPAVGILQGRATKGHKIRIRPEEGGFVVDYPVPGQDVRGVLMDWLFPTQWVDWHVCCGKAGAFRVEVELRCTGEYAGSEYAVRSGESVLHARVPETPSFPAGTKVSSYPWAAARQFIWQNVGVLRLPKGESMITLRPTRLAVWAHFADVRAVRLAPVRNDDGRGK